jgi:hypothetical protein
MRTTIDIADPVLEEVRRLQQEEEGKSLGALVSELLAEGLAAHRRRGTKKPPAFRWLSKSMGARIDLTDKEAVWEVLDAGDGLVRR